MSTPWSLFFVFVLVFANAFFVAAEFAFVTVRRTRIEQLVSEGNGAAKAVQSALANLDRFIAGTQVGITMASLALGWVGEPAITRFLAPALTRFAPAISESSSHTIAIVIGFTIVTMLHVILGELVPKSLALQKPELTSLAVARPMIVIAALLRPIIWSLNGLGNMILRLLGLEVKKGHEGSVHSATELGMLIDKSHQAGEVDELERRMIQRTFRFSETSVADVMAPRSEIVALDLSLPAETLVAFAANSSHTRLPAHMGNIDRIDGVVYLYELFRLTRAPGGATDLRTIIHPALFVPETIGLDAMLASFRKERTQMAIVVDEYGGTAGVVTMEDVVEAVFGEIQDRNDGEEAAIQRGKDGTLTVRGDVRLADLREILGEGLTDEESDTVAGYVLTSLGRLPAVGDQIATPVGTIRVSGMLRQRVTEVVVTPKPLDAV